jgi:AcrR family transcriptional regulator
MALMDAAERLFLERGVTATSVDDITTAARVAKGTFYVYFASRDALLSALQERFITAFCDRMRLAMDRHRPGNWSARLRTWFEAALDGLLDQVMLHDMLFHDVRPGNREIMKENPVITQLTGLLREGAEAGAWQAADPHALAIMMFHAMHGLADDAVARGTADRRRRMINTLTDTFAGAIKLSAGCSRQGD